MPELRQSSLHLCCRIVLKEAVRLLTRGACGEKNVKVQRGKWPLKSNFIIVQKASRESQANMSKDKQTVYPLIRLTRLDSYADRSPSHLTQRSDIWHGSLTVRLQLQRTRRDCQTLFVRPFLSGPDDRSKRVASGKSRLRNRALEGAAKPLAESAWV